MKYYDLYFKVNRLLFDHLGNLLFRYDGDCLPEHHIVDVRPPNVLYIPASDRESRDNGGETARALLSVIPDRALLNPAKTSMRKRGLSKLRFTDYTSSGIEEPIKKLLEEAVSKLADRRDELEEAEYRENMTEEEIDWLLDKYQYYAPRLIPEYSEFCDAVMGRGIGKYDRALTLDQMLEVVCRHVDGDELQLLPEGRNVFVIIRVKRRPLTLPYHHRMHFARFVVTFNKDRSSWHIESEDIADVSQERFKGKTTRLFWHK